MKLIKIRPVIRIQSTNTHCVILDSSKAIQSIWCGFKITDFTFNRRQNRSWTTPGASLLHVHCSIGHDLTKRFVHIKSMEWFVNRTWAVGKNVSETFLETNNNFVIVSRNIKSFRKRFLKHKFVSETKSCFENDFHCLNFSKYEERGLFQKPRKLLLKQRTVISVFVFA